jgi:hypothetical protein
MIAPRDSALTLRLTTVFNINLMLLTRAPKQARMHACMQACRQRINSRKFRRRRRRRPWPRSKESILTGPVPLLQ